MYQYACISGRENSVSRVLFFLHSSDMPRVMLTFLCAWGSPCCAGRAELPVLQSKGGHCWVHISATEKGLALCVSAVLSHTWGLASVAFQLPLSPLPLWEHSEDRCGGDCAVFRLEPDVLKSCLKARTQNIQRKDLGVYFVFQLAGCKSINIENTEKCKYLWIKDQVRDRDLGKA